MRSPRGRDRLLVSLFGSGAVLVTVGAGLIFAPAAWVWAGALLMFVAWKAGES